MPGRLPLLEKLPLVLKKPGGGGEREENDMSLTHTHTV